MAVTEVERKVVRCEWGDGGEWWIRGIWEVLVGATRRADSNGGVFISVASAVPDL